MASLTAKVISAILRTTGIYKNRYSDSPQFLDVVHRAQRGPQQLPTAKMEARLSVSETKLDGLSVWHVAPKDSAPSAHILYFHGGGYVFPAVSVHWDFMAYMATHHGVAFTAPLYPLGPGASPDDTIGFAMKAYRQFIADHPGPFVMGGDSAGGGLTSVVAQRARDEGLRAASGLLLICPWLDATLSHPDQPAIEKRDCLLTIAGTARCGREYAGDIAVTDPRVSPLNGEWHGLPPILCFGGGDDILVIDARRLKEKLPSTDYVEVAGVMHVWPIFFLPESREGQRQIAAFAQRVSQL
jgi:epsilon-lactone hydrolase